MKTYTLTPLDTLFFRDGRPFNLGETGQMEVEGVFPPSPTTVVGAMRAAFTRGQGWAAGDWNSDLKKVLGNHHESLGQLSFQGPLLVRNGNALFPAPLHLMGKRSEDKSEWKYLTFLKPGPELLTDLGHVRLPKTAEVRGEVGKPIEGFKNLESYWLTTKGMQQILTGKLPEVSDIVAQSDLWATEPRVGIKRDPGSRTTKEDSLYNIRHVRLREDVSLAVAVTGTDWQPQSPTLLGGESRMAWVESATSITLPQAPTLQPDGNTLRYTVTLMTPAAPRDKSWYQAGAALFGLPGEIVSACVGKPVTIGGWNSLKREPLPLEPHLPAGSTWFIEANARDKEQLPDLLGKHIGEKTDWGYGQILIGKWEDR